MLAIVQIVFIVFSSLAVTAVEEQNAKVLSEIISA